MWRTRTGSSIRKARGGSRPTLEQLKGLVISGDQIEDVRCYLTGESRADGTFSVTHYTVRDKHGLTRSVYNAKINIHRREAEPIFLGIRHKDLNLW